MQAISFQLYSARNFQPFSEVFKTVAAAGYKQVEGYGALYAELDDAALSAFKADLDANGLTMPSAHFSLSMLENNAVRAVEIAKAIGIEAVFCPHIMPEERPTDADGWRDFGKRLEAVGAPLVEAGHSFGWHNHDFEFAALPTGEIPMDLIFQGGPNLRWEADIAWVIRGGADPFDWIDRYGSRISAVHVKDIAPAGEAADEDGWADVGHGTVDWPRLFPILEATPAKYFVVEHDNPKDLQRFVGRSIAAIRTYG